MKYGNNKGVETVVESTESPTIDHLISDIMRAVEKGGFEVETPRVHATQDDFEHISVGKSHGPPRIGQLATQPGPPALELELDWGSEDTTLYEDFETHTRGTEAIALYGDLHLWNVYGPQDYEAESAFDALVDAESQFECTIRMEWQDYTLAGWR